MSLRQRAFDKLLKFWGENEHVTLGQGNLTVLVFEVDGHRYGVDAAELKEIVRAVLPSRLAQLPGVIEGVINVRGQLAAVLDLRARFGLSPRAMRTSDVLLLCQTAGRLIALHADAAIDLIQLPASDLASSSVVTQAALYARGMCRLPDGLLLICDLASFLNETERLALDAALAASPRGELPA